MLYRNDIEIGDMLIYILSNVQYISCGRGHIDFENCVLKDLKAGGHVNIFLYRECTNSSIAYVAHTHLSLSLFDLSLKYLPSLIIP